MAEQWTISKVTVLMVSAGSTVYMHDEIPRAPAMAVATVMMIFSTSPQADFGFWEALFWVINDKMIKVIH